MPNRDEVPGHGQTIPLPLVSYKNGYERVEKVSVGWDKVKIYGRHSTTSPKLA